MSNQKLILKLKNEPKQLFLIDGLGAVLSAFLLGVVLVQLEDYIGMPRKTLYILAVIPCFFTMYDWYCYKWASENWSVYIKGIAFANLGYCLFSIVMLWMHYQELTYLGRAYFVLEIMVVLFMAFIEFKVAEKL